MVKNKRSFLVGFHGEVEVEDYTADGARMQVEMMKDIKTIRGVSTKDAWYLIGDGFRLNTASIFVMILAIVLIRAWILLFEEISLIQNDSIKIIGLLIMVVVILSTLKLPTNIVSRFENNKY